METNLEKAKRLIKDNAAIQGIDLPNDGFIFKMLELAATPNVVNKISSNVRKINEGVRTTTVRSMLKCSFRTLSFNLFVMCSTDKLAGMSIWNTVKIKLKYFRGGNLFHSFN